MKYSSLPDIVYMHFNYYDNKLRKYIMSINYNSSTTEPILNGYDFRIILLDHIDCLDNKNSNIFENENDGLGIYI